MTADVVSVLADTGMRKEEALSLKWRQVDWKTKTDQPRSVPMTSRTRSILGARRSFAKGPFQGMVGTMLNRYWNQIKEVTILQVTEIVTQQHVIIGTEARLLKCHPLKNARWDEAEFDLS